MISDPENPIFHIFFIFKIFENFQALGPLDLKIFKKFCQIRDQRPRKPQKTCFYKKKNFGGAQIPGDYQMNLSLTFAFTIYKFPKQFFDQDQGKMSSQIYKHY